MRRYILLVVALMIGGISMAQEVVTDRLIYDRVSGYMMAADECEALVEVKPSKNLQTIRWEHDVRLWYGAPGLISELLLDNVGYDVYDRHFSMSESIDELRTSMSPMLQLSTVGVGYTQQLKPWLAVGAKATFAAVWQHRYSVIGGREVCSNDRYVIGALFDMRFSWLRRKSMEMYSSVDVGLAGYFDSRYGEIIPMLDVALVGITFGRAFYGFVEVGAGVGGSVRGGVGFRFNAKK